MRHKCLVLTVKKLLKSVYTYGSYRKIKTGVSHFLDHPVRRKKTKTSPSKIEVHSLSGTQGLNIG